MDAQFLLRIEDIDIARCKPELTDAIIEDLKWLGLEWAAPVMAQSDRFDAYRENAKKLNHMGFTYPCFCSRAEVSQHSTNTDPDGAPIYAGHCKHLSKSEISRKLTANEPVAHRLDMEKVTSKLGMLTFSQSQPSPLDRPQIKYANLARWGDVVIVRKDTPTSYHLSVVVDDAEQKITHVTRGRDMEAATDLHVLLQFLLGLPQPIYTFHRLILDDGGEKLSKSARSMSLRALREQGWTPEAVHQSLGLNFPTD